MVARLCRRAVGANDYALEFLDEVIKGRHLFLVFSKDVELIGMANYTPVFDKSAWLGMARTDPDWRGMGVAQFLQENMAAYARHHGVGVLRFIVSSTNSSSLRAAEKGRFRIVAQAAHASLARKKISRESEDFESIAQELKPTKTLTPDFVSNSNYIKKFSGYMSRGYAFLPATRENLGWLVSHGELFSYNDGTAFVLCKTGSSHGELCLLAGGTKKCLRNALRKADELNLKTLGGFLPYDRSIIRAGESLGFKRDLWARHVFLFERRISF